MVNRRNSSALSLGPLHRNPLLTPYNEPRTPNKPMATPFLTSLSLHQRSLRSRPILAVIVLLLFAAGSVLFIQPALLPDVYHGHDRADARYSSYVMPKSFMNAASRLAKNASGRLRRPQLQLEPAQELAAVTAFVAVGNNVALPRTVDPSKPIDPQLVLDFDTSRPNALEEVKSMEQDTWLLNPVVLYTDDTPLSQDLIAIMSNMRLRPSPTIIDVDSRPDGDILEPILLRITRSTSLPILLIGGKPIPSVDITRLRQTGELKTLISAAGASSESSRRPRNGKP